VKCCIQRVDNASVEIDNKIYATIEKGLLVLVGFFKEDKEDFIESLAHKVCNLRIFENENEKMDYSVKDIKGELLIVSQFTLAGDVKKGLRPDFTNSMHPDIAKTFYEKFILSCKNIMGEKNVKTGIFGAKMKLNLTNNGPVTIILEKTSEEKR
jgi:D-tyrosyl-tRNA(Tyr) deacylase